MKSSIPQRSVIFIQMILFYRPIFVDRDSNLFRAVAPGASSDLCRRWKGLPAHPLMNKDPPLQASIKKLRLDDEKLSRNVFRPSRRHNCEPRTKGRDETGSNAKAKDFPKIVWARPTDYTADTI